MKLCCLFFVSAMVVASFVCRTLASHAPNNLKILCLVSPDAPPPLLVCSRTSHEEDSNAYVWSYAKRAIGTHVLRQKHWPGNAMMHPPDPSTFATSVAIRSVPYVVVVWLNQQSGAAERLIPSCGSLPSS